VVFAKRACVKPIIYLFVGSERNPAIWSTLSCFSTKGNGHPITNPIITVEGVLSCTIVFKVRLVSAGGGDG
jgi:hypothetical protein